MVHATTAKSAVGDGAALPHALIVCSMRFGGPLFSVPHGLIRCAVHSPDISLLLSSPVLLFYVARTKHCRLRCLLQSERGEPGRNAIAVLEQYVAASRLLPSPSSTNSWIHLCSLVERCLALPALPRRLFVFLGQNGCASPSIVEKRHRRRYRIKRVAPFLVRGSSGGGRVCNDGARLRVDALAGAYPVAVLVVIVSTVVTT